MTDRKKFPYVVIKPAEAGGFVLEIWGSERTLVSIYPDATLVLDMMPALLISLSAADYFNDQINNNPPPGVVQ